MRHKFSAKETLSTVDKRQHCAIFSKLAERPRYKPMWSDWWAGPSNGNGAVPRNGSLNRKRYESTGATLIAPLLYIYKLVPIKANITHTHSRLSFQYINHDASTRVGIILSRSFNYTHQDFHYVYIYILYIAKRRCEETKRERVTKLLMRHSILNFENIWELSFIIEIRVIFILFF